MKEIKGALVFTGIIFFFIVVPYLIIKYLNKQEKVSYKNGKYNIVNSRVNDLSKFDIKSDGDYILTYNLQVELILNFIKALVELDPVTTLNPSDISIYARVKLNDNYIGSKNKITMSSATKPVGPFSLGVGGTYGYSKDVTKSDGTILDQYDPDKNTKYSFLKQYSTQNSGLSKYYRGGLLSRSLNNTVLLPNAKKNDKVVIEFFAGDTFTRLGNSNKDEQNFLVNNLFRGSVDYSIHLKKVTFEDL